MTKLGLVVAVLAGAVSAGNDMAVIDTDTRDWVPLSGAEIRRALSDRTLDYPASGARQTFHASGRTLYVHGGRESWGTWRIEADAYCSRWPPSDLWACYDMGRFEDRLRFVSPGPDVTEATYAD
jgi:hypothetical protein